MYRILITSRAEADIADAREWYQSLDEKLLSRFENDFATVAKKIAMHPFRAAQIERGVRRVLLDVFPYQIYYRVVDDAVRILAIYHVARDPERWNAPNR